MTRVPRWLRWLIDVAVVSACVIAIAHVARRRTVDCAWDRMRAACTIETEDALGRATRETITEVRGAAYRSGRVVGLVTDAQNHGEHALFGTRELELETDADAERLRAFAHDHDPDRLTLVAGVAKPRLTTGLFLAALLVYALITRKRLSVS
jgi:hypothetical protein